MSVYVVTGKLGSGKTKYAVKMLRDAVRRGVLIAGNLNLNLKGFEHGGKPVRYARVPDKPTAADLEALGDGSGGSVDEDKFGVLVLDELGTWLNARSFLDKRRAAVIDWLLHARKHGWTVYLIVQSLEIVDKQVRSAIAQYLCHVVRADRIRIPVVGRLFGKRGFLPRAHVVKITMVDVPGLTIDRAFFRADDLHPLYDTRQIFVDDGAQLKWLSSADDRPPAPEPEPRSPLYLALASVVDRDLRWRALCLAHRKGML